MDMLMQSLFGDPSPQIKIQTIKELENSLLYLYHNRAKRDKVEELFEHIVAEDFPMNSVCTRGPLFCFILDLKPYLSLNIIRIMVERGLDFGNIYMCGVSHRKMLRELEFNYSDVLWGIFIYTCQHTNFVETIPTQEMMDILFGKIIIESGKITFEFEPQISIFKVLLAYDKTRRIKKTILRVENSSLRECVKQKYPEILNEIINS
jgi:hypothetical protein